MRSCIRVEISAQGMDLHTGSRACSPGRLFRARMSMSAGVGAAWPLIFGIEVDKRAKK